jgi:two-component sensor histidine kinase
MENTREHPHSILLVEDSNAVRSSIAAFLRNCGYAVIEAEDGKKGLELFHSIMPDLVITDLCMPKVNGHEVVKTVAAVSPDTAIIVVSGTENIDDVALAINHGTWDYILKPITDFRVLLHSVRKNLEKRELVEKNRRYQQHLEEEIASRTLELQKSLDIKDQLLKEVHHRVKNNLQIIISLINLQIGIEREDLCMEPMEKMKNRISSMALVHEYLYHTREISRVPFEDYLKELLQEIKETYVHHDKQIDFDTAIDPLTFPVELAVPLGLIMNELVSNSFRHAFSSVDKGLIHISLKQLSSSVKLTVSDSGTGIPEESSREGTGETLGLVLVSTLASQLKGSMNIVPGPGGSVSIRFPGCYR